METKHTAGPWEVEVINNEALIAYAILGTQWPAETAHNRNLIAAAPDLYFEANAALECLVEQCGLAKDCELVEGLTCAIAKAEGRTS